MYDFVTSPLYFQGPVGSLLGGVEITHLLETEIGNILVKGLCGNKHSIVDSNP